MEQLNLQKSRRMAENWLDDHRRAAVASASEDERRLLETLYARQKGSMEYLGLIRLDMGQHADEEERELPMALTIPAHPAVCLLLLVAVLTFVLLKWQVPAVVAAIIALLQGLLMVICSVLGGKKGVVVPEVHEPYLVESELAHFLQQQSERIAVDAASIAERQAVTLTRERQDVGEDAVELYCALYEAALDVPDKEVLAYPLSVLKMSLLERGLEPVEYTDKSAGLFDVMPADCPGEMRWPAIRSRENGVVLKRGLYLRRS